MCVYVHVCMRVCACMCVPLPTPSLTVSPCRTHHHLLWVINGINGALLRWLVHAPDGAHTNAGINVGRSVKGVEAHNVVAWVGERRA